ncbi:MAG: AraC family transcriptional regulator [Clostridia bacterium]|nr:AraC family transcriptional regulator [Clostridia bacterium]
MDGQFRKFIKTDMFNVKYAKGKSDMRGKEFHEYNEIICFFGGEGHFISDRLNIKLKPNLIMIIPKACYHIMNLIGNENSYHRCVIHFGQIPLPDCLLNTSEVIAAEIDIRTKYLTDKILSLFDGKQNEKSYENIILSCVTLMLDEINKNKNSCIKNEKSELIAYKCIEIINKRLSSNISVSEIAKMLNVSPSSLSHTFKKEMNISVYRYILEKRLVLARDMILNGKNPTDAAFECGFNDYSSFYRQYKKMYAAIPSKSAE